MNKEHITPELIAAVKEIILSAIGISFEDMFEAYQLEEDGLTERDLISEILEAGEYQKEDDAGFEDAVMIGVIVMAGPLGLM